MSPDAVELLALAFAGITGAWAGLLALAEESPTVARTLGEGRKEAEPFSRYRMIHVSRLATLLLSGMTAGVAVHWWNRPTLIGAGVALVSVGFIYMIAEALPRAVGALAPEVAAAAAPLAARSVTAFRPLFRLTSAIERFVVRFLPPKPREARDGVSVRRELLLGVFSLADTTVAEVMTPRLDIVALAAEADWHEAVEVVRRGEHARIPVYTETLDNIAGILYAKDLVPPVAGISQPPERWQTLVRPAQFVPESKSLAAQLRDFQRGPAHLAVVVDEFGGTSGLVTLEDALEEVVGEIHDEYDVDEPPAVEREGDDRFWVDGSVTLDELSALLGFTPDTEDVTTVGGLVYAELGRVPKPGEEFKFAQFRVVVEQVVRRRIRRVYFERLDGSSHDKLVTSGQESA